MKSMIFTMDPVAQLQIGNGMLETSVGEEIQVHGERDQALTHKTILHKTFKIQEVIRGIVMSIQTSKANTL